jgi:uncharacterized membrane protein
MVWRSETDFKDRLFSSLVYGVPLVSSIPFGVFLFQQFPQVKIIYFLLLTPFQVVYQIPFGQLAIFFVLFLAVVRNEKIPYFIRFNTMQALLIDIVLTLFSLIFSIIPQAAGLNLIIETILNMIFLAVFASCLYSIVSSALGKYAEIPTISQVVYNQIRY